MSKVLRAYFNLLSAEGLVVLVFLLSIPADPKNAILFGFSPLRLGLLGTALVLIAIFFILSVWIRRYPNRLAETSNFIETLVSNYWIFWLFLISLTLSFVLSTFLLFISSEDYAWIYLVYLVRLSPFLFWFSCWCVQTIAILLIYRYGSDYLAERKVSLKRFGPWVLIMAVLLLGWGVISWSKIGLAPDNESWLGRGWGSPGVPLIFQQVLKAWGIVMGLVLAGLLAAFSRWNARLLKVFTGQSSLNKVDLLIALLLWSFTSFIWLSEPLQESWFNPQPRPPTYEYYPYSDAAIHDVTSQNLLIGEGFKWGEERIVRRPLYALFLAFLHQIGGQDYERVVALQVLVLAFLPVLLYLLTTLLHCRVTGILVAIFIILREKNAIALSNVINVSHAKLLMTDLPVTMGVVLFALLIFWWLKEPDRRRLIPLLAGGILGLLMLIRPQVLLLVSIPILLGGISLRRFGHWVQSSLLLVAGVALALIPWLWRNWQVTDSIVLDETSQLSTLVRHQTDTPEAIEDEQLPGETQAEYSQRLANLIARSVLDRPGYLARSILVNFIRNEIFSVIILPTSLQWESASTYVKRVPYWFHWDGELPKGSRVYLALNLLFIALGIGAAWKRHRFLGLVPLLVNIVYSSTNALARISGWRFILPGDWAGILYYGIGLSGATLWILSTFSVGRLEAVTISTSIGYIQSESSTDKRAASLWPFPKALIGTMILIILSGSALPIAEKVIPARFSNQSKAELINVLMESGSWQGIPAESEMPLETVLGDDQSVLIKGRAFYPRYYEAGKGEPRSWPDFVARSCDRLEFFLVGPQNFHVILPLKSTPASFPNGSEVIVLGYRAEDYLESMAVFYLNSPSPALFRSDIPFLSCSKE
jgi:hypothetical protein